MVCLFQMCEFLRTFFLNYPTLMLRERITKLHIILAKLVVNYLDNVIWMEDVPPLVFSFVQADLATVLE